MAGVKVTVEAEWDAITVRTGGETHPVLEAVARACWREAVQVVATSDGGPDPVGVAQALVTLAQAVETLLGAEAACGARTFWKDAHAANGGRSEG